MLSSEVKRLKQLEEENRKLKQIIADLSLDKVESFNGSFRDECLNTNWFMSLEDARIKIETWKNDYNEFRPHSGLTNQTPAAFAQQIRAQAI